MMLARVYILGRAYMYIYIYIYIYIGAHVNILARTSIIIDVRVYIQRRARASIYWRARQYNDVIDYESAPRVVVVKQQQQQSSSSQVVVVKQQQQFERAQTQICTALISSANRKLQQTESIGALYIYICMYVRRQTRSQPPFSFLICELSFLNFILFFLNHKCSYEFLYVL